MLKSFSRNKKIIFYVIILFIINFILVFSFNLFEYIQTIHSNNMENIQKELPQTEHEKQAVTDILETSVKEYKTFEIIFIINTIIFNILFIIILILIIKFMVIDQKEDIKIMRYLGYSNKKICSIILVKILTLVIACNVISLLITQIISPVLNDLDIFLKNININNNGLYDLIYKSNYTDIMKMHIEIRPLIINFVLATLTVFLSRNTIKQERI